MSNWSPPADWNPSAPSEAASDYDGIFSWSGESHAFTLGFGIGITGEQELILGFAGYTVAGTKVNFDFRDNEQLRQVVKEPAYALGGLIVGVFANRLTLGEPVHETLLALLRAVGVM